MKSIYYLVDKGSKSGIFINGQRVENRPFKSRPDYPGGADEYQIQFIAANNQQADQFSSIDGLSSSDGQQAAATAKEKLKNLARYVEINQAFKFSLAPDDVLTLVVDAAVNSPVRNVV